jgi:sarcosine oxidase
MEQFDCIVLGAGGFGSSALYHLARRGVRAVGLDRFGIAHDRGSSHGETRIIRKAYFEHPDYVPLLHRAYELWDELQTAYGQQLFFPVGLLEAGLPHGELIAGIRQVLKTYPDLQVEQLPLADARRRFPGFHFPDDYAVVFEPDAGYLRVEECVNAHIELAVKHAAVVKTDEAVQEWTADGESFRVQTAKGEYQAERLIVTAGPWAGQILADLQLPLKVTRKVLFWHPTTAPYYNLDQKAPTFCIDTPQGFFYGFPSLDGRTVKLAEHTGGQVVADPLTVERSLLPDDPRPVVDFIRRGMTALKLEAVRHKVCLYTNTPDLHFIIDRHPRHDRLVFGAGFSGHGFKFTSVLGQVLADLAIDGKTSQPVGFLGLSRPTLRTGPEASARPH